jgi:hypothetical protein
MFPREVTSQVKVNLHNWLKALLAKARVLRKLRARRICLLNKEDPAQIRALLQVPLPLKFLGHRMA